MNKIKNLEVYFENFIERSKYKLKGTKSGYPSIDKTHEKQYSFFINNQIVPSLSVYLLVKLMSSRFKSESAIDCDGYKVTFEQLLNNSDIVAKAFKSLNVKKGDIIVVSMPNYEQAVELFLGANKIGATVTFLNCYLEKEEVVKYLNEFNSKIFINYGKNDSYNRFIKDNSSVDTVVTLNNNDVMGLNSDLNNVESLSYSQFMELAMAYSKPIFPCVDKKLDSLILFTSGSTGNPKSVVLTNENIIASGLYMKNSTNINPIIGEKTLVCVPFCYPYGFSTSTIMSLLVGRQAVIAPVMSEKNIVSYLEKRPNIIFGSPALLELIMRNVPEDFDLSFVKTFISGGDLLTLEQISNAKSFFEKHGTIIEICNGAGNAETAGASTNSVGVPSRYDTVGKVLAGERAIIINPDTHEELKYGEIGTLYISGKNVFKEYYNDPKKTNETKLWFKNREYVNTGMRGFLDEDGYFTLTGRDSRYFIMSTLNKVYCDYVQNIISMIDVVESCAVVKKPDDKMLFRSKAYIVLRPGIQLNSRVINYIKQQCSKEFTNSFTGEKFQLKPYEIPVSFDFLETLPRKKDSEKIDYTLLEKDACDNENPKILKKINVL